MKPKTKDKLESLLSPFAVNINPNTVTFLSIILMLAAAYYVWEGKLIVAAILFAIAALGDALDGLIAKKYKRMTKFGAFFDRTADRINDSIIIMAIILAEYVHIELGLIVLFLVILASYMSATVEVVSKTRIGDEISLRPLRMFVIFLGLLSNQVYYAMWVLFAIALYAVLFRFYKAYVVLK